MPSQVATIAIPLMGGVLLGVLPASAQLVPDATLGNESSIVVPGGQIEGLESDRVDGGALRGPNLFHSFQEFNIDEGRGAYFANPVGVENILTRVTGNNPSNILGTLGVLGDADLFFINPNGIVFGPNARLDLGGSFVGSTADGLLFDSGFEFSASNPQAPPLLVTDLPMGLQFRDNPGSILNSSQTTNSDGLIVGLQVQSGNTLGLLGGDIVLDSGNLTAFDGHIELASIVGENSVNITLLANPFTIGFDYTNIDEFGDIQLSLTSVVDVSGFGRGNIFLWGNNIFLLDGSILLSNNEGGFEQGLIYVSSSGRLELSGIRLSNDDLAIGSSISSSSQQEGRGANIFVEASDLRLLDGGQIAAVTGGLGDAGNITIKSENIEIIGADPSRIFTPSVISSSVLPGGIGDAGSVQIETERLIISSGGDVRASTFGFGNSGDVAVFASDIQLSGISSSISTSANSISGFAGNLMIQADRVFVSEGAEISTRSQGQGDAGSIFIRANHVNLTGRNGLENPSAISSRVTPGATGNGGNITIEASLLSIRNGASIDSSMFGFGNAGDINIESSDVVVDGFLDRPSGISTAIFEGMGKGGELHINTERLQISNGAQVGSGTFGIGDSGNVIIDASSFVEIIGIGLIASSLEAGAVGTAGSIIIETPRLRIADGGEISSATSGFGDAGSINILADNVTVTGIALSPQRNASNISVGTQTQALGNGGQISIDAEVLSVSDGGRIATDARGIGNAGDITITASDITVEGLNSETGFPSLFGLNISPSARGRAGDLIVQTERIRVLSGGQIAAATEGNGPSGSISILADDLVQVDGIIDELQIPSTISVSSLSDFVAGNLMIDTNRLIVSDGAEISARGDFFGRAGNLSIQANFIRLQDGANIGAAALRFEEIPLLANVTEQGNLSIVSDALVMEQGSRITTDTRNVENGGNITIESGVIAGRGNSDITTNATSGRAGRIEITSQGLLGIALRSRENLQMLLGTNDLTIESPIALLSSDITAISEQGEQQDGQTIFNTPDVDSTQGILELPEAVVDPNELISQNPCTQGTRSEFTDIGRGGRSSSPDEVPDRETIPAPWIDPVTQSDRPTETTDTLADRPSPEPIVPARGWTITENGRVEFTADGPATIPLSSQPRLSHPTCTSP